MAFLKHVSELLEENGEYVDAQALTPARTWVRYGGPDAAPVTTDGPLPETSDLVAGWYMIDVESHERAVEIAAYVSSEPGPGGEPLYEWIDVREVMSEAPVGRLTRRDRRADATAGRGRAARPRPRVLAGLVRRGEDFDAAEDALQEALLEALRVWPEHPPRDPRAWLTTVATRRLVDARRSEAARTAARRRRTPSRGPAATEEGDDTLFLLFCCCHPDLAPTSQVALTLRAVGGLTTREIADAFYVPEATMAQRISRAKRALQGRRLDQPGDLAVVLRVLYLVYTAGHARPGRPGRRGDPARPPTHPRHRGAGGARAARADAPQPRPPPGAARRRGPHRHARPAGPRPVGHPRDRRGRARPAVGAGRCSAPAATRSRPPSPPCTTTRRAPRRPTGRRSSPGTTTWSPSATTRCTRTPPRCSGARSRSATSSAPPPGCARPTGCARCSASGTAGTPSAATCTSSAATSRRRRGVREAARRATDVAERDHLVRQAARARAAGL